MKSLVALGIFAALTGGMATQSLANPLNDICEVQAERISGYSGDRRGLTWNVGQFDFRLSGTLAIGLSHTSGSPTGTTFGSARPFAGMDALEQREALKKRKYAKAYQSCIQAS
ncbi:MAG: hypothetical protein L3J36_01530 [Rhodobacteraceae bacterium]|nr:hypothetical protein [Paracoccaceae bacterium]